MSLGLFLRTGRRLVSPENHVWIRAKNAQVVLSRQQQLDEPLLQDASPVLLEMGLTERGMDDIGDVSSIQLVPAESSIRNTRFSAGENLLRIEWEGHAISAADELYHTVWETISGATMVKSPLDGQINRTDISHPWVEEEVALLDVTTTRGSLEAALGTLLTMDDYLKVISRAPPGCFADST